MNNHHTSSSGFTYQDNLDYIDIDDRSELYFICGE